MNDFTKEELIELLFCRDTASCLDGNERFDLGQKIQSMIDNYKEQCPYPHDVNTIGCCPYCKEYHE